MKPSKRTIRREKKKKKNEEIQRSLVTTFGNMKIAHEQSYDVPLDLIPEILSRLPAESVVRFRAVCKHWYYITTTPGFIKSFTGPPSLLLRLALSFTSKSKSQCQLVFSFPQNSSNLPQVESYQMTDISQYEWVNPISESVHGLVLLSKFVIWNPTTGQFFSLPDPTETYSYLPSYAYGGGIPSYLGYDPVEGEHKVLHLSKPLQVITLGAQESWRFITEDIPRDRYISDKGPCFNGVIYFDIHSSLMSFDVRSEKFKLIKYPEDYHARFRDILGYRESTSMISYEGRLALVSPRLRSGYKVDVCVLEDADGDKWTSKCFLLPLGQTEFRDLWPTFHGVTEAGEFIITSWCVSSFRILYFDPRRNRIRDSLFNGIDIDHHGCKRYDVVIIPNHIESLLYT